jgi:hypothetical protein
MDDAPLTIGPLNLLVLLSEIFKNPETARSQIEIFFLNVEIETDEDRETINIFLSIYPEMAKLIYEE